MLKLKEEEREHGVFYDDDYNYLQHLKDRTLVEIFTFRLDGAPEELLQRTFIYSNVVNSPSSIVMTDDVYVYAECQQGLETQGGDWVSQHRNAGQDQPYDGADGGIIGVGSSELPIRNQFRAWHQYMTADTCASDPGENP